MRAVWGYTTWMQFLQKIFRKSIPPIRIGCFGMLNNPEYRQEPWKESIQHRLECFDSVVLICGHEPDVEMLAGAFPLEWANGKLKAVYQEWPFPEWSYEQFPKHLNTALILAKQQKCDWVVKLDIDTIVHEKDYERFRRLIAIARREDKWLVSFSKRQFFTPFRYWRKSSMPIALNTTKPIVYGFDETRYTDLCQPIVWDEGSQVIRNGVAYDIPQGRAIHPRHIQKVRSVALYNYDFTFRTKERSIELLYQIEMAHARFWGVGYSGLPIEKITRETSLQDFLELSRERYGHMHKRMDIAEHPRYLQAPLSKLTASEWGFDMWGTSLL